MRITIPSPISGIRAVFLAGFFTGNAFGLLYLLFSGNLLGSLMNPLALGGAFIGVGILGTMIGGITGLGLRLLLGEQDASKGWEAPIIASVIASALMGLFITNMVVEALA
jgi:hypothetical protein